MVILKTTINYRNKLISREYEADNQSFIIKYFKKKIHVQHIFKGFLLSLN